VAPAFSSARRDPDKLLALADEVIE